MVNVQNVLGRKDAKMLLGLGRILRLPPLKLSFKTDQHHLPKIMHYYSKNYIKIRLVHQKFLIIPIDRALA